MTNSKFSVVGISRSVGDYNGQKFDNTYLHCIRPADVDRGQVGQICEIFKIKTSNLHTIPEINSFICPVYNKFGQVESVNLV